MLPANANDYMLFFCFRLFVTLLANFSSIYIKLYCVSRIRFGTVKSIAYLYERYEHTHTNTRHNWEPNFFICRMYEEKKEETKLAFTQFACHMNPFTYKHTEKIQFLCSYFPGDYLFYCILFYFTINQFGQPFCRPFGISILKIIW